MIDFFKYGKLLRKIGNSDDSYDLLVDRDGKFIKKFRKSDVNQLTHISNEPNKFVGNVHFYEGVSLSNIKFYMENEFKNAIVIDSSYIYGLQINNCPNIETVIRKYNDLERDIKEITRLKVMKYNVSLRDYLANINHLIMLKLSSEFGWWYDRVKHGFYDVSIPDVVIPPCELPYWILNNQEFGWDYAKKHIKRWKNLVRIYPELRRYDRDVGDENYIPINKNCVVDLRNV